MLHIRSTTESGSETCWFRFIWSQLSCMLHIRSTRVSGSGTCWFLFKSISTSTVLYVAYLLDNGVRVRNLLVPLFRGGLVSKAHRLLYHSTLGSRVFKKKKKGPKPVGSSSSLRGPHPSGCCAYRVGLVFKAHRLVYHSTRGSRTVWDL